MTLEDALHLILSGDTDVAALIGEPSLYRIWRGVNRQNTRTPYLRMQRTTTTGIKGQCGTAGTEFAAVTIDSYAKTQDQRDQLARAVFLRLRDFSGTIPDGNGGSIKIKDATRQNEFDLEDPEPGLYRRTQLWGIWYIEI